MSEGFRKCRERGGRIRTKKLGEDQFQHTCYADGQAFQGKVEGRKVHGELMASRKKSRIN